MPLSRRLSSSLAVRLFAGAMIVSSAGCCCGPVGSPGVADGCLACNSAAGSARGAKGHLHDELRRGEIPSLVPPPAPAAPIARYHPLPTHPVFEPQADYSPLLPIVAPPPLAKPPARAAKPGEPTPAPPPTAKPGEPTPAAPPASAK